MDRLPSEGEMWLVFLSLLRQIGPWYVIPLFVIIAYSIVYGVMLHIAAVRAQTKDQGKLRPFQTRRYAYTIFWDRLSRYDIFTLIYIFSIPAAFILFLVGTFTKFGSQIKF